MSLEIERKFLVRATAVLNGLTGERMSQAYLGNSDVTVRVRMTREHAWLTIKGPTMGIARKEFEYAIPLQDAVELSSLATLPVIDKTRYRIPDGAHVFEVDVFHGANAPLVVAEVELSSVDEDFAHPPWLGAEISDDPRYRNSELAKRPYNTWQREA